MLSRLWLSGELISSGKVPSFFFFMLFIVARFKLVRFSLQWVCSSLSYIKNFGLFLQVDYTTVFVFRLLMFIDNGLAAGMVFYCGLVCIACMCIGKWLSRRQALVARAQNGVPVTEYRVIVDMIQVPDWAFEAAGQEMRGMGQDNNTAYHPGLYLTPTQREAVEALIQELPKFRLKVVPTDCSECPICLEEFRVGNEV
ncbi:unnamed protein product [Linum tenue]|nr:unnamed protein product [Linum tenue]